MHDLMGDDAAQMPEAIKGVMLSCILSDTLAFRSPTTTPQDKALAESLAADLNLSIAEYAAEMFAAKSDVSAFSDSELLRMDSKEYSRKRHEIPRLCSRNHLPQDGSRPQASLMAAMPSVAQEDSVDHVLLFVVDILNEEATMLIPNAIAQTWQKNLLAPQSQAIPSSCPG